MEISPFLGWVYLKDRGECYSNSKVKKKRKFLPREPDSPDQQRVSALHIPRNFFFLSAKDCYHLVWEPRLCRYSSDTIFWIYGCWYDYCINAYDCQASQNGTSKCRCLEDENAVASQKTGSFFFIFEKREARRSGANGFFNQVMLL